MLCYDDNMNFENKLNLLCFSTNCFYFIKLYNE